MLQQNLPQHAPFTCCSYAPLFPWGPTYWDCTQALGHTESQARSMCSTGRDRWHCNGNPVPATWVASRLQYNGVIAVGIGDVCRIKQKLRKTINEGWPSQRRMQSLWYNLLPDFNTWRDERPKSTNRGRDVKHYQAPSRIMTQVLPLNIYLHILSPGPIYKFLHIALGMCHQGQHRPAQTPVLHCQHGTQVGSKPHDNLQPPHPWGRGSLRQE